MNLYSFLRSIGHKYFPGLIVPFRETRIYIKYFGNIPDQIHDINQIKNGEYNFKSQDAISLEKYYTKDDNKNAIDGIVFMCDGKLFHGGPSDRIRGILTTYREAKKRNIPFFIHWNYPFNLEEFLVPSGPVNWKINDNYLSYSKNQAYPVVIMHTREPQALCNNRLRLKAALNILNNRSLQIHVYSNAPNSKRHYKKLYQELFKPSELLQKEINYHLNILGDLFYSFTFRFLELLGDFIDHSDIILSDDDAENLIAKVKTEFGKYLKRVPEDYKILVTSDSIRFLESIKCMDPRIYIVPGKIQNIDMIRKKNHSAWLKTFVDQQLIMHAEKVFLLRTGRMYKSGFPEFAAIIGGKPFYDIKF